MIREEAIGWLQKWQSTLRGDGSPLELAILKAIEALKQPEIVHCKDCKFNENEDGTTACDFHTFWCAYDDGYCNFGQRREKNNDTGRNKSESNRGRETKKA